MVALFLVAVSVGFSNLAAAVGVGAGGITVGVRVRVALIFGLLEAGMPIIGLQVGRSLAGEIGHQAHWLAGGLLVAVGGYTIVTTRRATAASAALVGAAMSADPGRSRNAQRTGWLVVSGIALSMDNLVAGFALGAYQVGLAVGALVFGVVSVLMSLAGLEVGARLSARTGSRGELIGGLVLIAVGIAIGFGAMG